MLFLLLLQSFAAVVASLLVWKIIYNLYFHPLAKFPGPLLARITRLHDVVLFLMGPQKALTDVELHRKYGPIVRVRPNTLSFRDARLLPVVYHRKVDKGSYYDYLKSVAGLFTIVNHSEHAIHRKMVAAPFTVTAVKNMRPMVEELVDDWIEAIVEEIVDPEKVVDFGPWGEFLTYDIITKLCFGEPYGFIKARTDKDGLIEAFHQSLPFLGVLARLPTLGFILKALGLVPKEGDKNGLGAIMAQRDRLIERRINERKNSAEKRHDILEQWVPYLLLIAAFLLFCLRLLSWFSYCSLLEAQPGISLFDIKTDLFTFMLAGSDTSGSFFRSFFIAVLTRPEIYKELIDELLLSNQGSSSTNLETEEELNGSFGHGSGSGMSLLDACIKETLRCYPPAPQPFSRLVGPGGLFLQSAETTISSSSSASKTGVFVPEGTEMTGAMVLTNCDPSIYGADAEAWNPSRWIECGREKVVEMDKYLQTFGYGTRLCLGKPIAELEIELGLKKFLTTFEPELVYPDRPAEKIVEFGVLVHYGLWMRIKRREVRSENKV